MSKKRAKLNLLDYIELYLARWTGRSRWPSTNATIESRLNINSSNAQGRSSSASFLIFSYEVEDQLYTAAVRQLLWRREKLSKTPERTQIQYNPGKPQQIYYAAACALANRMIFWLCLLSVPFFFFAFHWSD